MRWTWDRDKAAANRAKHGVSFETAKAVFDDPFHLSRLDEHPDAERWQTIGMVGSVVLLVVHTSPEGEEPVGRIISARKATARERKVYEEEELVNRSRPRNCSELRYRLQGRLDNAIDTSDAPEILDWSNAKRGVFYRPVK